MNVQRSTELKVGVVSFFAIILLIIGISLGKGLNFGVHQNIVQFRFPSSGGIETGAPVFINGVKRGSVGSVANSNNAVLVTASIENISDLYADASAKISMLEITGGRKIEINPGHPSQPLDISKEIPGSIAADATELVGMFGEVGADARILIKRLDTISAAVTTLLADGAAVGQIRHAIGQTDTLVTSLNGFFLENRGAVRGAIADLNGLAAELRAAVKTNEPKARKLLEKLDSVAASTNALLAKIDLTAGDARTLIADARDIARDIRTGNGLVSRAIYDTTLTRQLDSTIAKMTRLMNTIEEHGVNVNLRLGTRP